MISAVIPRLFIIGAIGFALSSCSKPLTVNVRFDGREPVFTFSEGGLTSAPVSDACIWLFEVYDDISGKAVITRRNDDKCVQLSSMRLSQPPTGLTGKGGLGDLIAGRTYHVEVIWEKGVGESMAWVAR